jgi:hypothetical protein
MKQMKRTLLAVTMLLSTVQLSATTYGRSYFLPRAQNGTAVDALGWSPFINKYDADAMYFDFKVQSEFRQSFDSSKLGKYLCFNGENTMTWGPTNATLTAPTTDINSINFLLPQGFSSSVEFSPKVQSSITSFDLYVGLDEFVSGLWASALLPVVYTRWNTHISETSIAVGPQTYGAGEVQNAAGLASVYADVTAAYKGDKSAPSNTPAWSYGKIDGSQNETKLGDVALNLGYNFVSKENMYLGVAVRGLFGAGGHSKAEYVFEPTVGYGGRMGVGGMVDAGVRLWERDEDHNLHLYFTGYAVHLFSAKQNRSYDITACGTGSRYNLVKKLTIPTNGGVSAYGNLDNMINIGTQHAKIGINVAYEFNLQFTYQTGNIGIDAGYSGGGHGSEKFGSWVDTITPNTYVLYGSNGANALTAVAASSINSVTVAGVQTGAVTAVNSTNQSTYCITNASLNPASALAPSVYANTIYGDVSYTWRDNDWQPNVSLFGNVEFGGSNKTLSTWGVGLQGNVSY